MKVLQKYIPIIPIIGKADTFTQKELIKLKQNIIQYAKEQSVEFFDLIKLFEVSKTVI